MSRNVSQVVLEGRHSRDVESKVEFPERALDNVFNRNDSKRADQVVEEEDSLGFKDVAGHEDSEEVTPGASEVPETEPHQSASSRKQSLKLTQPGFTHAREDTAVIDTDKTANSGCSHYFNLASRYQVRQVR